MQSKDEKSSLFKGTNPEEQVYSTTQEIDQSKGARPKVRNPKEAKRRRFVMKQAKPITKPQFLESVSESEEAQVLLPKDKQQQHCEEERPFKHTEFFGVKSYVHNFYEAMAMDNPEAYEDMGSNFGYLIPIRKRRKQFLYWRLTLYSGLLILLMGLISLLVGFLVPKRAEVVGFQEDIEIINRVNQAFNRDLNICKIVGIILFCVGGSVVSAVLLVLILFQKNKNEDPLSEEIPMTEKDLNVNADLSSTGESRVPATEALTAIQPKRLDPEEVVMTNAGLCKVPP